MGCGMGKSPPQLNKCDRAIRAALLIQRWYRQYVARLEMRRRCTWNIFQSIEYAGEQDQIKVRLLASPHCSIILLSRFNVGNIISHIFHENETCRDTEWERYFCYRSIEVPDSYNGPHLTFPMTFCGVSKLVEAFKHKQQLHARYVLQLLGETWRLLRILPNINYVSACHTKEITICGTLQHSFLDTFMFSSLPMKHTLNNNGLPSSEKPYVFNGDYVDRGKSSLEILLILFGFLLVYPNDVHLNRGNHEDHIVNLRYGFTKEVLGKYRVHGKKILKLLQKIFSWLPLATVIDHKVLIVHGGISDTTDLNTIARVDRHKHELPRRSLHNLPISSQLNWSVEEELKRRRRLAGFDQSYGEVKKSDSDSDPDSGETMETDEHEWKQVSDGRDVGSQLVQNVLTKIDCYTQIVDVLWSDPVPQNGCFTNEVRGGGCYWGPDVTEEVLGRHNLQLLIRSHECKQDGYEFCHNRKVVTIFSASNYYEVGSNRGAYIRMGPDLVPHFIQYQASQACRELTLRQSVGRTERSALRALRKQLYAHKSDLISAFQEFDPNNTGMISLSQWASATESILKLGLPWRVLRSQLASSMQNGTMDYQKWIREFSITEPKLEVLSDTSILETMYKNHSNLETIFRIIDTDHSGSISFEEFHQTWKLLSSHLKTEISDKAIADLAQSIDFNKDGSIDINEFMEAFRLVDLSAHT
uniref:Serine/threonine-protein phosphatase with EF-hands n=1 Tax=Anabas testudineus TaxID=64144 RepID=A0A3Q1IPI5_ANATE